MYLFPCSACRESFPVSPSKSGEQVACPHCQASVEIPKFGELRQFPSAEQEVGAEIAAEKSSGSDRSGGHVGFLALAVIATASLLIAGFCTVRYALIDVPTTTESHLEQYRQEYTTLRPAELIREYEQIEKYGVDLAMPYKYKVTAMHKQEWGRNASISGLVAVLTMIAAMFVSKSGRASRSS